MQLQQLLMNQVNLWTSADHTLGCLAKADSIPYRTEGEAVLLELVPKQVKCILDWGTGDSRLLSLLKIDCPQVEGVAVDFYPTMLEAAKNRFTNDTNTVVIAHNTDELLASSVSRNGLFDAVVSSFAIHYLTHAHKQALDAEILDLLKSGGVFCNLEHLSSPTPAIHAYFRKAIGSADEAEDPSNHILDVETQLNWLYEIGYANVDCYCPWLELVLLVGCKLFPMPI